jgi:hypothetical protein
MLVQPFYINNNIFLKNTHNNIVSKNITFKGTHISDELLKNESSSRIPDQEEIKQLQGNPHSNSVKKHKTISTTFSPKPAKKERSIRNYIQPGPNITEEKISSEIFKTIKEEISIQINKGRSKFLRYLIQNSNQSRFSIDEVCKKTNSTVDNILPLITKLVEAKYISSKDSKIIIEQKFIDLIKNTK